ncbi:MAG: YbaN family protein [Cytophagales bacterium]|nr:YbaN family protein [Cytophagales bacterium]
MKKALLISLGTVSLGLGLLGIIIPGLPTTPFLLLASFLYLRSSRKLYLRLIRHKYLGKYILEYERNKGLTRRQKVYIIAMILGMSALSVLFFISVGWGKILTASVGLAGVVVVGFVVPTVSLIEKENPSEDRSKP